MPYLLDTYNILHAGIAMGGAMSGLTVRKLCQWIVASPQRLRAILVLDGRPKPDEPTQSEFPDLDFIYSGAGISADTVIAQTVERSPHRKKLTAVTNDRAVALHARKNSASAISSEAFLQMLIGAASAQRAKNRARLPDAKTSPTLSPGESAHWLKEFGLKGPDPAPPPPPSEFDLPDDEIKRLMGTTDDPPPEKPPRV